jgi:tetratricopeptide (TPR) repeat protein
MARSALSLDDIKVPPAYSQAEAAASRKDFEEALRLYRKAAEEYPDEPEPCRRIAELYLTMGRPDDAVRAFRETEERQPDPRDKLLTVFAIVETLADVKKDLPGAIEILERFLTQYPDVKGREYAEGRIRLLRSRLGNAAQNGGAA